MVSKLKAFLGLSLIPLLCSSCSSLLYYPTYNEHFPPSRLKLSPEEIWVQSETGEKLYGWYFHNSQSKKPKALLIYFHGNAENLSSHYLNLLWLLPQGYDFFIFDYGGYGRSSGDPSPFSTVSDGKSILRFIHHREPDVPLVIFGQSLGGAISLRSAIEIKNEVPISLIVVDSSFLSYKSEARSLLSKHWLTWVLQPLACLVMNDSWAPLERVKELSPIPLLIMHGDQDRIVDISLGEELYQVANEPKEFWKIENGAHIDSFQRPDSSIRDRFLAKLESLFSKSAHRP